MPFNSVCKNENICECPHCLDYREDQPGELKRCPFDGKTAQYREAKFQNAPSAWWVECSICEVGTKYQNTKELAAEIWNARLIADAINARASSQEAGAGEAGNLFSGRDFRISDGSLFWGTLRLMRADFDTNPSEEYKQDFFARLLQRLNGYDDLLSMYNDMKKCVDENSASIFNQENKRLKRENATLTLQLESRDQLWHSALCGNAGVAATPSAVSQYINERDVVVINNFTERINALTAQIEAQEQEKAKYEAMLADASQIRRLKANGDVVWSVEKHNDEWFGYGDDSYSVSRTRKDTAPEAFAALTQKD